MPVHPALQTIFTSTFAIYLFFLFELISVISAISVFHQPNAGDSGQYRGLFDVQPETRQLPLHTPHKNHYSATAR